VVVNFRYEDKKGFSRLLALSDIEEFVQEVEPCMNNYNQTNKDTDIQSQALLVDFIVSNIKQYKSIGHCRFLTVSNFYV
jgi:signal recognition particle GTPase